LGCQTAGFLTVFAGHLSIFTLTIITVERWFAIKFALYLNKRLRFKSAVGIMIAGWIYSMCMAAMPLFGISNYSSTRFVAIIYSFLAVTYRQKPKEIRENSRL
jgi:thyroid stimulating hormone receptor